MNKYNQLLLFFFIFLANTLHAFTYRVRIEGVSDDALLESINETAQICNPTHKKGISGIKSLKQDSEEDIEKITQAAKFFGYLSAHTIYSVTNDKEPTVIFKVTLGPLYHIDSFTVVEDEVSPIEAIPENLSKNIAATTPNITNQEQLVLDHLLNQGYRSARITKREIRADLATHTVDHMITIERGEKVYFDDPVIHTSGKLSLDKIRKCVLWKKGDVYSKESIEQTKIALEKTNFFSEITIHEDDSHTGNHLVNVEIDLEEMPHHTVGAGLSYMTFKGPGIAFDYEDRNIRNLGEKFAFRVELWKKFQTVAASFQQQDLLNLDETVTWATEYNRQKIIAFSSRDISVGVILDKKIAPLMDAYIGARLEALRSFSEHRIQRYWLLKSPFGFRYNSSNDLLDPTRGVILHTKLTPAYQFLGKDFTYFIHNTTFSTFCSLPSETITLATKITFGNIVGSSRNTIPPPDRFFGGSDNSLRGYKYQTVSPLDRKGDPIGGRSLLTGTVETRFRTKWHIGWVLFYDIGNVYTQNVPDLKKKQFHSYGFGARYTTPIGPLRLDIGIPLNRRKKLDSRFQVYFSIGQAF